ncbi:MAG: urate hydroxylase PuuD [Candidatus Acidiferrales bacterium]
MSFSLLVTATHALAPQFSFPQGSAIELIMLRWLHFIFGIIWIGLLYFFNLVGFPTMKQLEAPVRAKMYPVMMTRAMNWFRWSALITVLVGLRYYFIILSADAHNSGNPSLTLRWFSWWLLVWLVAYALIYPFQLPSKGILNNPLVRALAVAAIVIAASWLVLDRNSGSEVSNAHLCIAVGGGIGFLMLMNTWGVVWRVQKKLIAWTQASVEQGTPMPPEAERLARWGFLASRVGFWLSFPMLFLMGAAEHYPFLSSVGK